MNLTPEIAASLTKAKGRGERTVMNLEALLSGFTGSGLLWLTMTGGWTE